MTLKKIPRMPGIIVSDASCLILFDKIGELDLLRQLFESIIVSPAIIEEFGAPLPNWIKILASQNTTYQTILEATLDKGEASAIALAVEHPDCLLIIDDLKGRKFAKKLGLTITGSLGILIAAKKAGTIPTVKPFIDKIKQTNFRISDNLVQRVLTQVNE